MMPGGGSRAFVVGHPVAHSRSPMIHGFWLRTHGLGGRYDRVDVAPAMLPGFIGALRNQGFAGGNVTVPHKEAVLRLVDELDPAARAIGAVNTLWFEDDRLIGGNSDAGGYIASLDAEAFAWDQFGGEAVVLGAGGAARAVVYAIRARGLDVHVINRTPETAALLADTLGPGVTAHGWEALPKLLGRASLLVNTTVLGMVGKAPLCLDLACLRTDAVVSDIVYVPLETPLLRQARERGHRTVGGLGMLLHQAVFGFTRWFGLVPAVTPELRSALEADVRGAGS